jgi:hypothetical protein
MARCLNLSGNPEATFSAFVSALKRSTIVSGPLKIISSIVFFCAQKLKGLETLLQT